MNFGTVIFKSLRRPRNFIQRNSNVGCWWTRARTVKDVALGENSHAAQEEAHKHVEDQPERRRDVCLS